MMRPEKGQEKHIFKIYVIKVTVAFLNPTI